MRSAGLRPRPAQRPQAGARRTLPPQDQGARLRELNATPRDTTFDAHMPVAASMGVTLGFAVLAIAVAILFVVGNLVASRRLGDDPRVANRIAARALVGVAAWMVLTALAAASGVLARFDSRPPPIAGLFLAVFAVSSAIGFTRAGDRLARGLPLTALVGVQGFRLPLELVMHQAARDGLMPAQMSFSGWNFDIVTGATAIALAVLIGAGRAPRALIVAWNALGIALLTGILSLALASTPTIHAFGKDARAVNTFVAYVPFVWLPAVLVVAAIVGHIVITRKLLMDESSKVSHGPTMLNI